MFSGPPLGDSGASVLLSSLDDCELITSSRETLGGEAKFSLVTDEAGEGGLHSSTLPRRLSSDSTAAEVRISSLDSCKTGEKNTLKITTATTTRNKKRQKLPSVNAFTCSALSQTVSGDVGGLKYAIASFACFAFFCTFSAESFSQTVCYTSDKPLSKGCKHSMLLAHAHHIWKHYSLTARPLHVDVLYTCC